MDPRARELIDTLQLQAHPEGGWYREVFRSPGLVQPDDGRAPRSALTCIYFLLEAGRHSRWHKVLSDEVWVHLEGAPLELWEWDAATNVAACTTLGPVNFDADVETQHVIAAGLWQAALPQDRSGDGFTLVSCVVGPGFDFSDFSMMAQGGLEAIMIGRNWPELSHLI